MRHVCVFDVNETLLDLTALDTKFSQHLLDAGVRREWFAQLLSSAFVSTITGAYRDFGTLGRAALRAVAERHGTELDDSQLDDILSAMWQLPPHPDVTGGLEALAEADYRLAALTNSTTAVARKQLEYAGIASYFERILSVDAVRRFKPAPETYLMAARELDVPIEQIRLVAAHGWDVAGAMRAGAAAAFIARPGLWLDPAAETPDIVGADLIEVARLVIDIESTAEGKRVGQQLESSETSRSDADSEEEPS